MYDLLLLGGDIKVTVIKLFITYWLWLKPLYEKYICFIITDQCMCLCPVLMLLGRIPPYDGQTRSSCLLKDAQSCIKSVYFRIQCNYNTLYYIKMSPLVLCRECFLILPPTYYACDSDIPYLVKCSLIECLIGHIFILLLI